MAFNLFKGRVSKERGVPQASDVLAPRSGRKSEKSDVSRSRNVL